MIDEDWDRAPTALEAAHYDALMQRKFDEASVKARKIFGDCLLQLIQLGMPEKKARPMLGKWRSHTKDDDLLVRIVSAAHSNGTPDPVSYITKALGKNIAGQNKAEAGTNSYGPASAGNHQPAFQDSSGSGTQRAVRSGETRLGKSRSCRRQGVIVRNFAGFGALESHGVS